MKVKISEIPENKTFDDYPEDTIFVLDDRPRKYNEVTGKFVKPSDPDYDSLPDLVI